MIKYLWLHHVLVVYAPKLLCVSPVGFNYVVQLKQVENRLEVKMVMNCAKERKDGEETE